MATFYVDTDELYPVYKAIPEEEADLWHVRDLPKIELTDLELEQVNTATELWAAAQKVLSTKMIAANREAS